MVRNHFELDTHISSYFFEELAGGIGPVDITV